MSPAPAGPRGRRRPLVSGNWKMHLTHLEAIAVTQKLAASLGRDDYAEVDVSIHPAFTALRSVQTTLESDHLPIALGAQNVHWEQQGAVTGEISPPMLAKLNVSYVIVGHSERRHLLGETDEMVHKKVRATVAAGLTPICCVGETLEQREAGESTEVVVGQVAAALDGVAPDAVAGLVLAYEPVWAIGTGRNAHPDDAQSMAAAVRAAVAGSHGPDAAQRVRIQYGGSVNPDNAAELLAGPDVDGALVGGASLDPTKLAAVVRAARGL
ncbi:MAG TPA: triose-phosphate isomerase [Acidimicrobiales bacterium]|nr:triose-phosphate isomerase [Acidimicrobiales bacterium]